MSAAAATPRRRGSGRGAFDPSKNVLDLVAAMERRQDDLREASEKRSDDLREQESGWRDRMDNVRQLHTRDMRQAETDRIDAIRAVDVGAVNRAAEVAAAQATALAGQVAASAEALRNQVAAAATAQTVALAAALEPIIKDIADLRRAQYEQQGQKAQVQEGRERGSNFGLWVGIGLTVVTIFVTFTFSAATIGVTLLLTL